MVFMALTTPGENRYIPFKDSKLTRLLKDSLGGNSLTTLLCTASRKVKYTEDTIGTLGFAQRAKKIKNNVKQNIMMGVKEYKYLADAMKNEIKILRGDLQKAGVPIHIINDKIVLQFLPNNEIEFDKGTDSEGRPRRNSLQNLTHDQIIIKYCELKAKYDNLLESAGRKISELTLKPEFMDSGLNNFDDEKFNEELKKKDQIFNELNKKHEAECDVFRKTINELEAKLQASIKEKLEVTMDRDRLVTEGESTQDMLNLNFNDITALTEKLNKTKNKKKDLKEKSNRLENELADLSQRIDDLYTKVSESEYANQVYEAKIADLNRIVRNHLDTIDEDQQKLNEMKAKEEENLKEINELKTTLCQRKEQSAELK
jgi:DNA repair exonuclease SbcCD ATPase subunit